MYNFIHNIKVQNCIYHIIMVMLERTEGHGEICLKWVTLSLVGGVKAPLLSFLVLCYCPCFLHNE